MLFSTCICNVYIPSAKLRVLSSLSKMQSSIKLLHHQPAKSSQALWPVVGPQERLWGTGILFKFFDWLLHNGLHCFASETLR